MKTVEVRIAVAVGENGIYHAYGANDPDCIEQDWEHLQYYVVSTGAKSLSQHIITAEIPLPAVEEIKGTVEEVEG